MPRQPIWVTPEEDETLNLSSALGQDPKDPRALGEGPCGDRHKTPVTPRASGYPITGCLGRWGQNQCGRWLECEVCALRLKYWPRQGYNGKYQEVVNPLWVTKAIAAVKEKGESTHMKMKGMIGLHRQLERLKANERREELGKMHFPPRARPTPKAAPKAAPAGARSSEPSKEEPQKEPPPQPWPAKDLAPPQRRQRAAAAARSVTTKEPVAVDSDIELLEDYEDVKVDANDLREEVRELKRANADLTKQKNRAKQPQEASSSSSARDPALIPVSTPKPLGAATSIAPPS